MRYCKIFGENGISPLRHKGHEGSGLTTNGRELTRIKNETGTAADALRTVIDPMAIHLRDNSRPFAVMIFSSVPIAGVRRSSAGQAKKTK